MHGAAQPGWPAYRAHPAWLPLALALGLHLLLVLAWLGGATPHAPRRAAHARAAAGAQERAFTVVLVARTPPSRRVRASPERADRRHRREQSRPGTAAAPARAQAAADSAIASNPLPAAEADARANTAWAAASATAPATAPDTAPATAPDTAPATEPAAAAGTETSGDLLATSKRMAGRVDHELRRGASPITAEPDRKWEHFAQAVAGAHAGGGNAVTLARYTAPDGVVIYRKTVGGRVHCYRSGSVGGPVGGFGPTDGRGGGSIPCPSAADWRRQ